MDKNGQMDTRVAHNCTNTHIVVMDDQHANDDTYSLGHGWHG